MGNGVQLTGIWSHGRPILPEAFTALVSTHRFRLVWQEDHTAQNAQVAERLLEAYQRHRAEQIGSDVCERLVANHRVWVRCLTTRRVRKLALVVERSA